MRLDLDNWGYPTYHAKECEKNFNQFWLPVSCSFSVSHIHCFSRILFSCPTWGMCTFEISFFIMVLLFNLLHILISLYSLSNRSVFISSELSLALEILPCRWVQYATSSDLTNRPEQQSLIAFQWKSSTSIDQGFLTQFTIHVVNNQVDS